MQGKVMSEQITEAESYVGIDVSGNWLDIHILPEGVELRAPDTRRARHTNGP